jgi:hypothetical protein
LIVFGVVVVVVVVVQQTESREGFWRHPERRGAAQTTDLTAVSPI